MSLTLKTKIELPSNSSEQVQGLKSNRQAGSLYRGFSLIKKGGMGTILRVTDSNCGRVVAMKMCTMSENGTENLDRLLHEARVTANLEHPNIIPIHEINCDSNDDVYYTMKFVQGDTLERVFEKLREHDRDYLQKYTLEVLLNIFLRICDGVAFAHSKGVIHRDLKPENIMLGDYGEVLIMDWGIAKVMTDLGDNSVLQDSQFIFKNVYQEVDHRSTQSGAIFGTPAYMAPEQIRGENEAVDQRTDIYALGGILYGILTLQQPIVETDINLLFNRALRGDIIPPAGLEISKNKELSHLPNNVVSEPLSAIAMKALATEKVNRYENVVSLQKDIKAYMGGYATVAEKASSWRKLALLMNRNAIFIVLLFFIVTTTAYNIHQERVTAEEAQELKDIYQNNLNELQRANEVKIDIRSLQQKSMELLDLAESKIAKGLFDEAKVILNYLEFSNLDNPKFYYLMGQVFEKEEKLKAAIAIYKRALRRMPNYPQAAEALQRCQKKLGEH